MKGLKSLEKRVEDLEKAYIKRGWGRVFAFEADDGGLVHKGHYYTDREAMLMALGYKQSDKVQVDTLTSPSTAADLLKSYEKWPHKNENNSPQAYAEKEVRLFALEPVDGGIVCGEGAECRHYTDSEALLSALGYEQGDNVRVDVTRSTRTAAELLAYFKKKQQENEDDSGQE